jgi:hypothetical protein
MRLWVLAYLDAVTVNACFFLISTKYRYSLLKLINRHRCFMKTI